MDERRHVILITDGDDFARKTVELVAKEIGGRCLSLSHGNPSILTGQQIVKLIKKVSHDPVLVMFDDSGFIGEGTGENALKYVACHKDIDVLGIIAVASKTRQAEWTKVDVCIDNNGELTPYGVDKFGVPEMEIGRINGDTVYCLDQLDVPIIVGIGDIGKMSKKDHYDAGSPITKKAVELVLERSGYYGTKEDERR
ncbi:MULTISPECIES: stage V sporulation protein AE [Cytobacillus]|uniref:Stage V sporulation protein AE n=3 Tax=Cytobacillus TaxID=2675230 RepID=A0A161IYJ7_9BACI|nr:MULTISPECIES: stage V sporulation protein AE [Cytobacillus]MBY0154639.1 stage V sporulation protein AE [Cytobacillus firmus]AND41305.1 stage V sporulation protein AE [Cytobacillus oceanisediminis 2691]MBU8731428.1 stage V sporulation protein AE [Cytobacillus oceanisediminis]MCM3243665.1 stage V sporulation protein AE [Cytobacillus oceanisediminis]MCM3393858.1 stage V sporulation protein AE [Cytobacillus oceanisediminis]